MRVYTCILLITQTSRGTAGRGSDVGSAVLARLVIVVSVDAAWIWLNLEDLGERNSVVREGSAISQVSKYMHKIL